MIPVVTITLLSALIYSAVIALLSLGIGRLKSPSRRCPLIFQPVTVVIPFRNEASCLPLLIGDLSEQSYPADKYRVILINDHSQDDSKIIVESLIMGKPGFYYLDLPEGKKGKKEALLQGISHVQTEWIIQTDADCRVGPDFISGHMAYLEENPSDLVAGLVTTFHKKGDLLEVFERLDLLSLVGAGAGSFYFGRPLMCSGANLLYSRGLYFETREFDPVRRLASGDDMFLMIGARKLGKKLSYSILREAMVKTHPVSGIGSLIKQRVRWGSKSVSYKMADIQLVAIMVTVMNLLVLLIPLWVILFPGALLFLAPAFLLKTLADFLLLRNITFLTGQRGSLRLFIPGSIIYYFYLLAVLTGTVLKPFRWKERKN